MSGASFFARVAGAVHGFDRGDELRDAIAASTATVVEHLGRITGYTTGIAFFAHTVGETNQDLKALIGAARVFAGPGPDIRRYGGTLHPNKLR